MSVEFRLLGAVEASIDSRAVDLGSARQRCAPVVLLVEVDHVVPVDLLVAQVWGERPPHSVAARCTATCPDYARPSPVPARCALPGSPAATGSPSMSPRWICPASAI